MVSRLDIQSLSMTIYNNLNKIIDDASVSAGDLENYSELRNALLSDAGFKNTVRVGVQEADGDTIALEEHIRIARDAGPNSLSGFADHIMSQIIDDKMPSISELTEGYKPSADFSIQRLQELQTSDQEIDRDQFAADLTNINPRFAEFFDNVNDSDGWFSDDPIVAQVDAALNGDTAALNQLIEIAGDDARMDALVNASATEAGRNNFSYVLEQASIDAPAPVNQDAVDRLNLTEVYGYHSAGTAPAMAETNAQIAAAVQARRELAEPEVAPATPITQEQINAQIAAMPHEELREKLATAHDIDENGNGGANYETYKAAFVALTPDYIKVFDGLESQAGALGINPAQELLVGALNNPESTVLDNMILYADDPEQLQALTAMVTDDGSDFYHLADERQMSDLIHSLARENGLDVHATSAHGATPVPEILDNGQVVNPEVQEFGPTVQTQVEIMQNAPEVIVSEGTQLPDNIPEANITYVTPQGLVPAAPDDTFQAPETSPSPPTATVPFIGASANTSAPPVADPNTMPTYEVEAGDNLWKIAEEQYELTNAADIMRAVDHIARANGLENGTDANHINDGQDLNMPSANQIKLDVDSLNWKALDADTAAHRQGGHYANTGQVAAAPMMN